MPLKLRSLRSTSLDIHLRLTCTSYNVVDNLEAAASQKFGISMGVFRGLTFLGVNGLAAALLGYGGVLVSQGLLTAGDLTSYLVTALAFQRSVGKLLLK